MESKIYLTLNQWFPKAFSDNKISGASSDYEILNHFAKYAKRLIKDNGVDKSEPFKIINLLYSKGTLFERNAIENEFFYVLAIDETPITLIETVKLMPEFLRSVYIKTILEN